MCFIRVKLKYLYYKIHHCKNSKKFDLTIMGPYKCRGQVDLINVK